VTLADDIRAMAEEAQEVGRTEWWSPADVAEDLRRILAANQKNGADR
jgi:hypothetical protein